MLRAQSPVANVRSRRRYELHFGTVCAFVAVNVVLMAACLIALWQNTRLRHQIANYVTLLTPRNGTVAPPLEGVDQRGVQQTIVYGQDQLPTLIYNFSQKCPYCQENWRALRALQALVPGRLRIVYIDTVGDVFTPKYLAANHIEQSPLLVQLSPAARYTYEARLMPEVMLVDPKGKVQWSHVGEFAPVDVSKVLSMVGHD